LNTELLPAFGLPTTATVAAAFRWIAMRATGTAVSATAPCVALPRASLPASAGAAIGHHVKPLGLFLAQRDRRAVDPHLERIPAQRAPQERQLGPFHETEHHEPLDGGIRGFDGLDSGSITGHEIRECQKFGSERSRANGNGYYYLANLALNQMDGDAL
jgi:hypothetical protein